MSLAAPICTTLRHTSYIFQVAFAALFVAKVDQDHKQIAHAGLVLSLVEVGILPVENRFLEGSFTHIVI